MADYNLPTAAGKVKATRTNFTFFQGKKSNQVFISSQAGGSRPPADVEKECGETKPLFKGVCFLEGEQMVFATKSKPSMVWEVLITKVFKEKKASRFLPVVLRQLGENESDAVAPEGIEDGSAPVAAAAPVAAVAPATEPAPATPATDAEAEAAWREAKADISPRVNTAIRANPPNRDELLGLVKQGLEQEKTGAFANALSAFRQLEKKLPSATPAGAAAPTPPPPPPTSPPPGGKVLSASELSLAMQKIVPRLQQAVAAQPARRAEILAPAGRFQAALSAGKLGEAQAAMMEALALVKTLAPVTPAAPGSTVPPPPPGAPPPPAASPSPAAASESSAEDAEDERAYNEAADAAFTATWGKASKVWLDCVEAVDGQIEKVRSAMQSSGDPDFAEIADKGMAALTNNHKTPVMVALREVNGARGEQRAAAAKKARVAIESFRNHLVSDDRIGACDEECEAEFGVALNIREEIGRGLDELELALDNLPAS